MCADQRSRCGEGPRTLRHSALSTGADRGAPKYEPGGDSLGSQPCFEPSEPGLGELFEGGEFRAQNAEARGGDTVGPAAVLRGKRFDPAFLLQAGNGAVKGAGAKTGKGKEAG